MMQSNRVGMIGAEEPRMRMARAGSHCAAAALAVAQIPEGVSQGHPQPGLGERLVLEAVLHERYGGVDGRAERDVRTEPAVAVPWAGPRRGSGSPGNSRTARVSASFASANCFAGARPSPRPVRRAWPGWPRRPARWRSRSPRASAADHRRRGQHGPSVAPDELRQPIRRRRRAGQDRLAAR